MKARCALSTPSHKMGRGVLDAPALSSRLGKCGQLRRALIDVDPILYDQADLLDEETRIERLLDETVGSGGEAADDITV